MWGRTKSLVNVANYSPLVMNGTKDAMNSFYECYDYIMILEALGIVYDNKGVQLEEISESMQDLLVTLDNEISC